MYINVDVNKDLIVQIIFVSKKTKFFSLLIFFK